MALGTVGSAVAAQPQEGIESKIIESFKENQSEGVENLLDSRGIHYGMSTVKETHIIEDDADSDVSPAWAYSEASSELNMVVSERPEDNRVLLTVNMALEGPESLWRRDVRFVDDVIGIGFDENTWTSIGSPNVVAIPSDSGDTVAEFWTGSVDGGGLPAIVNLHETTGGLPSETYVSLQTDLETEGAPGTLWGYYEHTKGLNVSGNIKPIGMGAGPFTVNLSFDATTEWEQVDNIDPEPYL